MKIWKYELDPTSHQTILMPLDAEVLSAHSVGEHVFVWAKHHDFNEDKLEPKSFMVVATGVDYAPNQPWRFIDTVLIYDGALVYHIFTM